MKTNKISTTIRWIKRILTTAVAAVLFVVVQGGTTNPQGREVQIAPHDESPSGLILAWQGISNAMYRVEQRTNLVAGTWQTWAPWYAPLTGMTTWLIEDEPELSAQFFRIQFPTPEITGGEPAFVPEAGGTTVYVTGNYFYEGDQIRVDGVLLTNVVFINHNLLSGELPDLAPGLHDVDVLGGLSGNALVALPAALQVSPPFERTVQGPPEWPLAGPASPRGVVEPRDPSSGQATGKRMHSPRSSGSGLPTGRRMHSPLRSSGNGGQWGDPHENASARRSFGDGHEANQNFVSFLRSSGDGLDPDTDNDGLSDVCLYSGEVRQQTIDLAVPGRGLDFVWGRSYRSRTGVASSQGNRWTHSYDVRCVQNSDGDMEVFDGSGRKDIFRLQADGTYTCPEFFREGTLDPTTVTFRLTFADTGYWEFCPFDAASPDSGKLARIVDRNNNTMTLNYGATGQLIGIVDDLGRTHTVTYTSGGQVASVTDSSGRTVAYTYYDGNNPSGCPGDLLSVTSPSVIGTSTGNDFPSGKTTTYTYTTGPAPETCSLLLSVVDARAQTAFTCAYDLDSASPSFARCISVQRGTGAPTCITYLPQTPAPANSFAAMRCIVNDPEGNVSEQDFDLRNRCLSLTEFTGRVEPGQPVTASVNRPTDPLRPDDPASFKITWTWNDGSLCTSQTLPGGARDEWVYQSDLDSATPPRFRANLRTERCISAGDLNGDGDFDEVVTHFEHDPRFGSSATAFLSVHTDSGWVGFSTPGLTPSQRAARTGRNPQTGKEIKIAALRDAAGNASSFFTRAIDPSGFETQSEYDAKGNLISSTCIVLDRTPPQMSFAYNTYGQLIAITNALDGNGQRRVDALSYYSSGLQHGYLQQMVVDAGAAGHNLTTSYEYDARGNMIRYVDPRGTATQIEVNALDQIVACQTQGATFGERAATLFIYDANDNLVQMDRENRAPNGTLDAANPYWTTAIVYDALNRPIQLAHELTHVAQQLMMTNQFVYNANDNLTLHRLPEAVSGAEPDNVITYAYDERGLLFSKTCAPGTGLSTIDIYDYDGNGNVKKFSQSAAGIVTESTCIYDRFGRLLGAVDAMGNVTTHRYDACGNRTFTKIEGELVDLPGGKLNRTLAEVTFTYDDSNQLSKKVAACFDLLQDAPIGDIVAQTTWAYAPNGQLLSCTDANGHTTTSTYDSAGRRAFVTDPKGNTLSYAYDSNGNLLSEQSADVSDVSAGVQMFTQLFAYDALNRCISVTDNVGNTVSNAYDSLSNLVKITDALGNQRVFTVDGLGRVTDTTQYSGAEEVGVILSSSQVVYRNNRCISSTDGNGNTTLFGYDACDRCVTTTHADGSVAAQSWSPRNTLAVCIDANGTTVTNTYDLLDRLIQRDIAVAEGASDATTFEIMVYDGLGQLVAADNDGSALSFAYDSLGNRIRSVQDGMVTTSAYDGTGNRLSLTCPDGRVVFTARDNLGLPTVISTRAAPGADSITLATLAYDGPGRLAKIERANSINTRVFWNGLQNAANDFGWQQISRINHARAGDGQVIDQRNSSWDRNQNQVLNVMTTPWTSGGQLTEKTSGFDSSHRLTRGTRSRSPAGDSDQIYVLDANGNRLQVTNSGVLQTYFMTADLPEPADFQVNQYTETPSGTFNYDANGNRVFSSSSAAGQRIYYYDYANRLVQVDKVDGLGELTTLVAYRFSAMAVSRELDKSSPILIGGVPGGTTTTTYLYDHSVDQDCDGVDDDCDSPTRGGVIQTYVDGVLQRTFIEPNIFKTSGAVASINGAAPLFHHYDDQGSLLALTDATGAVVERFDYGDYGAPIFFDAVGNPRVDATGPLTDVVQLFQGMAWNAETALYSGGGGGDPSTQMNKAELIDAMAKDGFSQCRTFDPAIGRDLSRPYGSIIAGPVPPYAPPLGGGTPLKGPVPPFAPPVIISQGRLAPLHSGMETGYSHYAPQQSRRRRDGRPPELVRTVTDSGSGGQSSNRAQDHNSSRSNKTASLFGPDSGDGGNMGNITGTAKKVAKFKAGKALADVVK